VRGKVAGSSRRRNLPELGRPALRPGLICAGADGERKKSLAEHHEFQGLEQRGLRHGGWAESPGPTSQRRTTSGASRSSATITRRSEGQSIVSFSSVAMRASIGRLSHRRTRAGSGSAMDGMMEGSSTSFAARTNRDPESICPLPARKSPQVT
jgi:hypothetical protein